MTEFRRDPLTHRWIVTGFDHSENPEEFMAISQKRDAKKECPFCEGKEFMTPPETFAIRPENTPADGPGWRTRVVPNRATDMHVGELRKRGEGGIYDLEDASGVHETVIETPCHICHFSELPIDQMADVFKTFQQRNAEHKKNHVLKGTVIFRNQGKRAAGIYEHAHSQIISFPFIPKAISDELNGARKYYSMKTRCIFCDMISEEKQLAKRVVYETEHYFAWCPFASRFPFETCIIPKKHGAEFLNADSGTFNDLARTVHSILAKYNKVLGDIPVSLVVHTAPLRSETEQEQNAASLAYHWHVEIMPHAWQVGAFEWGGDLFLAPPTPETCAKILANTNV